MNNRSKVGLVLIGYAAAILLTYLAFLIGSKFRGPDAGGGMQAFGDLILFAGLFGGLALVPTALALYFLRSSETFWKVFSTLSLSLAATGPIAAVMMGRPVESPWLMPIVGFFGLLRLLGAPLLGFGYLVGALFAPIKRARRILLAASATEGVVAAYVFVSLILFRHWLL